MKRVLASLFILGVVLSYQACSPDVNFTEQASQLASGDGSVDGAGGGSGVGDSGTNPNSTPTENLVPKAMEQSFGVSTNENIDVLFVVDNSGSMKEEQANMSSKINGFMNLIKDLKWHVALTTTDPRTSTTLDGQSYAWGDGQFRPFDSNSGSVFVLKSESHSLAFAQSALASAIVLGTSGNGDERAINASYRAIERGNSDFFRADAKLVIIVISDEDECSNGNCLSSSSKSVPENLVSLVQSTWSNSKVFMFNSIIRAKSDTSCTTASVANVYESMSKLTGGIIGSVCASDYTSILSNIGSKTAALAKSVNLSCAPADTDGDGVIEFRLFKASGEEILSGFTVSGSVVTFATSLADGNYSAKFNCLVKK